MTPTRQHGDARLLRRVRRRLVLWSAASTLVLLVLLGAALYFSVQRSLEASGIAQLQQQADSLADFARREPGHFPGDEGSSEEPDIDSPFGRTVFGGPGSGTLAVIVDEAGEIAGPLPRDSTDIPVADAVEAAVTGDEDIRNVSIGGTAARVLSVPIEANGQSYVIQVFQDRSAEERTLTTLLIVLVAGGLVVLAVAVAFGFAYAGRALVPIRESLRRQREFAADASHELRTPLTIVRASVEDLRRHARQPVAEVGHALDDIDAEVGHLASLVDDLLLLARADSGVVELRLDRVDLAEAAEEAVQGLRSAASARGVSLRLDAAPVSAVGDADRLRQLVRILVDNAIRHTPTGGSVTVTVSAEPRPALVVEDDGPGIRASDLPHLFDRFWRAADAPTGGTGLGLAIARWIAEHHGGRITATNRPDGGGARFEVTLPGA